MNYSPELPRGKDGNTKTNYAPSKQAVKSWGAVPTISSVITLTDDTTEMEIGATGGAGVAIKWVSQNDTVASVIASGATANFDHIIPSGSVRRFVVPVDPTDTPAYTSIVGTNVQMGLINRIAWIQAGAAATASSSVFGAEYR